MGRREFDVDFWKRPGPRSQKSKSKIKRVSESGALLSVRHAVGGGHAGR